MKMKSLTSPCRSAMARMAFTDVIEDTHEDRSEQDVGSPRSAGRCRHELIPERQSNGTNAITPTAPIAVGQHPDHLLIVRAVVQQLNEPVPRSPSVPIEMSLLAVWSFIYSATLSETDFRRNGPLLPGSLLAGQLRLVREYEIRWSRNAHCSDQPRLSGHVASATLNGMVCP